MWLTRMLLGHRYRHPKIPGRQYTGKRRKAIQLTSCMMRNVRKRLDIEEENARHLAIPYLTKAEEYGQREYEEQKRMNEFHKEFEKKRLEKMKPHRLISDHVGYLSQFTKWE
ncbi:large ribosomal subunit protein mL63-like [Amphiura filiformis]|uniref:large ribosomal subunit protein mL63-like n=1 Tax=Amphiura filiformis TaxID=82378 RepID=UPI003B217D50